MQHCAAAPQSRFNNDFGRELEGYIKGRKSMSATKSRGIGGFHLLVSELAFTAMLTSKWGTVAHREEFKEEKQIQDDERREKEEIALKYGLDIAKEEYIDAIYMFQKYHSPRRWKNKKEALEIFSKILKEGPRREAVKASAISGLQIYT